MRKRFQFRKNNNTEKNIRAKKGAASFYLVAISMVVLLILATSFAVAMIGQSERSSNDDLSQSAYDSALAGIEDAKLAFYQYRKCKSGGTSGGAVSCEAIKSYMEAEEKECDMVGRILYGKEGEIVIQEENVENNMQQAYTCVTIETELSDYRASLNSSTAMKVVKVSFKDDSTASKVKSMKISWVANDSDTTYRFMNVSSGGVTFPRIGATFTANPPTISVAMIQTSGNFTLDDFYISKSEQTNRGMVYLVPTDDARAASRGKTDNSYGEYLAGYNGTENQNHLSSSAFVKSNDHTTENLPYMVYCDITNNTSDFICSATIDLPDPINGSRNNDTFYIVVALPYEKPDTDFSLEFYCNDTSCGGTTIAADGTETNTNQAILDGVQVKIDSTGRASDLYRRVETRLEASIDASYVSLLGPLQLYSDGTNNSSGTGKVLLEKNYVVTREYGL